MIDEEEEGQEPLLFILMGALLLPPLLQQHMQHCVLFGRLEQYGVADKSYQSRCCKISRFG
jgi:hypothetical protein